MVLLGTVKVEWLKNVHNDKMLRSGQKLVEVLRRAFLPAPVTYPQRERRQIVMVEEEGMKLNAREIRGPLSSTMRPHTGPVL